MRRRAPSSSGADGAASAPIRGRVGIAALLLPSAVLLSACGSSGGSSTTTTTAPSAKVQNLSATPAVEAALVAAFAKSHLLKASDYTGLTRGKTYYAYDSLTGRFWAGAQAIPSGSSIKAEVSTQDDGAYAIFTRTAGGTWIAYNDGLGGIRGSRCSIVVPTLVRTLWGWSTTTPCGIAPGI